MWNVAPIETVDKDGNPVTVYRVCDDGENCQDFESADEAEKKMDEWNERDYPPLSPGM